MPALHLGLYTSKIIDRGVIERIGPYGLSQSLYNASSRLASADTGSVATYSLFIFIGAISLILLLFIPALSDQYSVLSTQNSNIRLVLLYGAALFYMTND